jgi:hypothetical protein
MSRIIKKYDAPKDNTSGTVVQSSGSVGVGYSGTPDYASQAGYADKAGTADYATKAGTANLTTQAENLTEDSTDWTTIAKEISDAIAALKDVFLSKTTDDTAQGIINFVKGLHSVGDALFDSGIKINSYSIDKLGNAILKSVNADSATIGDASITNIVSNILFKLGAKFSQGLNIGSAYSIDALGNAILDSLKSSNFDEAAQSGFSLTQNGLLLKNLTVWGKAIFHELEIRKVSYTGGVFIFSPAGGTIFSVVDNGDSYRCYLLADDGTTQTTNLFAVGDQALCQSFNIKAGVYTNVSNKRYWRKIVAVSDDTTLYDDGKGHKYAWVDLSKTDCEDTTNDAPSANDVIVTLGNDSDPTRQNAIMLDTVADGAPIFALYKGINTYTLEGKDIVVLSPAKVKIIATELETMSTSGEVTNVAEAISTVDQKADSISLSVTQAKTDAAADATTKANNALSSAKSYADTTSANAKSSAISTAASDATAKANAAQAAATSAAQAYTDMYKIIPSGDWVIGTTYAKNSLLRLSGQLYLSNAATSSCPIVLLTDDLGNPLVTDTGAYIPATDDNGKLIVNADWDEYTSNESLDDYTHSQVEILKDSISSKVEQTAYDEETNTLMESISDVNQRADSITAEVSQVKTDASSDATAKANAAQSAAINAAASDATTKANNAQTAATTAAKTYTDSQVTMLSDEISSKVSKTDYDNNNNSIQTQLSDIDQKADSISLSVTQAKTDAAADATTKANNALSSAKSYADTTSANAKSSAISTAASDATAKANAAQAAATSAAQAYTDMYKIIPSGDWVIGTTYAKNSLLRLSGQLYLSNAATSSCPIVLLTDDLGNPLVTDTGAYIPATDDNGKLIVNADWDEYTSNESLDDYTHSQVEILKDSISSKVEQTAYDEETNTLMESISDVNQRADSITAEVSQVKTDASSDATAKANAAQSAAINAAASDATTKANNAQTAATTAAKTYTDSQVTMLSDEISSKVSKTDYDSNNNSIQTQLSDIDQKADSISLSVTQAKTDAATDATNKANDAINSANGYTDSKTNDIISGLTRTSIDIISGLISANSDNFVIKNNAGAITFSVDKDGNIVGAGGATFSGTVVATAGKIGKFSIDEFGLRSDVVGDGGGNVYIGNANHNVQINAGASLISVRADGDTGISVYTQDTVGIGIRITAQTSARAILSYGSVYLVSRRTEGTYINNLAQAIVAVTTDCTVGDDPCTATLNGQTYFPSLVITRPAHTITVTLPSTQLVDGQSCMIMTTGSQIFLKSDSAGGMDYAGNGVIAMGTTVETANQDLYMCIYYAANSRWYVRDLRQ